jgi:hypothetical protein
MSELEVEIIKAHAPNLALLSIRNSENSAYLTPAELRAVAARMLKVAAELESE